MFGRAVADAEDHQIREAVHLVGGKVELAFEKVAMDDRDIRMPGRAQIDAAQTVAEVAAIEW